MLHGRKLLEDPDPVAPLAEALCGLLRNRLQDAAKRYAVVHKEGLERLETTATWQQLGQSQRDSLIRELGLEMLPSIKVACERDVIATLQTSSLTEWDARILALPQRFASALEAAARLLEPKAHRVGLPTRALTSEAEIDAWLGEVREVLVNELKKGPVIT